MGLLPQIGESHKREETIMRIRGGEGKHGSHGLAQSETARTGSAWVWNKSSMYILWLLAWCFVSLLTVGVGVSLTSLGTLFLRL